MKKTVKEITLTKEIYICDFCGKESERKSDIKYCEDEHIKKNCGHEFDYQMENNCNYTEDYMGECIVIIQYCHKCEKKSKSLNIDVLEIEEILGQEKLKELFEKNYRGY